MKHLNSISTVWSWLQQAHCGNPQVENNAKRTLLDRYSAAVRRYVAGMTNDHHAADEISQEFAIRLWQGRYRHADQKRGRFRDYIKKALSRLLCDHRRRQRKYARETPLEDENRAAIESANASMIDAEHRQELYGRTWIALAQTHPEFYAVLRFRVCHTEATSQKMAHYFSQVYGRTISPAGIRQTLCRARKRFLELVVNELAQSLPAPTANELAQGLADLGLLDQCRTALQEGVFS